jgi:hypothetical protein
VSPDSTAAGNGERSATLTPDLKDYDTFSAAISVKRKTTAAKKTVLHVTFCFQVYHSVQAKWLAMLLYLQGVKVSYVSPEIDSFVGNFHGFPQFLQASAEIVP